MAKIKLMGTKGLTGRGKTGPGGSKSSQTKLPSVGGTKLTPAVDTMNKTKRKFSK